jgi:hypothetical protein
MGMFHLKGNNVLICIVSLFVFRNFSTVHFVAYATFISTFFSNLLMYMATLLTNWLLKNYHLHAHTYFLLLALIHNMDSKKPDQNLLRCTKFWVISSSFPALKSREHWTSLFTTLFVYFGLFSNNKLVWKRRCNSILDCLVTISWCESVGVTVFWTA